MTKYTFDQKKKLATQLSKIRNKTDALYVYEIINKLNDKCPTKENNKKTLLFFHELTDETYDELEKFIKLLKKKKRKLSQLQTSDSIDTISQSQSTSQTNTDYKPYAIDEFPSQKDFTPKYKFSNKEKNIIKRKNYDNKINKDSDEIVYTKFNVEIS
jgi:hypothetical protein